MTRLDVSPDCQLSTGRLVVHIPMENGAQRAQATPGREELTAAEWDEYCMLQLERARRTYLKRGR